MTFNTNSCTSRYSSVARLANRRHSLSARLPELVQTVLGRRRTLDTLRRFYCHIVNCLDIFSLQNMIFRRSVRHIWRDETGGLVHRYARREPDVPEELCRLPAAKPVPSPMQPPEPEERREPEKRRPDPSPVEHGLRLTDRDFRVLVRGVADALGRQSRLESLRRGGM